MFEILPERNAIYVPALPTTGKYEIGSTNHSTPNELAPAINAVIRAEPLGTIPNTTASIIAGTKARQTPKYPVILPILFTFGILLLDFWL